MRVVVQECIDALSTGGLDAVAALGIALVFGVMRMINFAQASLITVGCYVVLVLASAPWPIVVVGTVGACALLAVALDRVAFRPVREANMTTLLVTSFAVATLIQSIIVVVASADPYSTAFGAPLLEAVRVASLRVTKLDLVTLAVTCILLGLVVAFLRYSRIGLELRAATEDFAMALLLGVRADRVIAAAFAISGALAAAVALLLTAQAGSVSPTAGLQPTLVGFVATVVGGMGSLAGAVGAGFVLGFATGLLGVTLSPQAAPYDSAIIFACVAIFLVVRPQGLRGSLAPGERP
jgi:branched-chain amino acid transport system permease protein